jgi:hypothetical protein
MPRYLSDWCFRGYAVAMLVGGVVVALLRVKRLLA